MVAFADKKKSTVPANDKGFGQGSSMNKNMPVQPNMFGKTQTPYTTNVKSKGGSPIRKPMQPGKITPAKGVYPAQVPLKGGSKSKVGMPQKQNVAKISMGGKKKTK